MSLQHAAKHLAAHGRGKDTELIHMDKGEIASLQQIAKANGGSLTINPHTGLPEAGFLSAMLPMIAGAGLMLIPGMQAGAAGLIVGGLRTAQSGSLSKGIMAGLGAYGGAGLAGSAGAAGAGSTTTLEGAAAAAPTPPPVNPAGIEVGGAIQPSSMVQTPLAPYPNAPGSAGFMNAEAANFSATPPVQPPAPPVEKMAFPGANESYVVKPNDFNAMNASERASAMGRGASFGNAYDFAAANPKTAIGAGLSVASGMKKDYVKPEPDKDMGQRYSFTGGKLEPTPAPDVPTYEDMLTKQGNFGRQKQYFNNPTYTAISPTAAKDLYNFADGGPVEQMSNNAAMGANTMYPMANMATSSFATPYQTPQSTNMLANMVAPSGGGAVNAMSGEPSMQGTRMAEGGEAEGAVVESRPSYTYDAQTRKYTAGPSMPMGAEVGNQTFNQKTEAGINQFADDVGKYGINTPLGGRIGGNPNGIPNYIYDPQTRQYQQMASGGLSDARYNLGGYSDGGRLLRGPGDGVSDSIPAVIGKKQPARLADGEFVVPARIVSELGNGSTEAGARKLYAMMDRVQASRKNTVGKGKVAKNNRADKYLPA
jgi:hypothetical protein